MKGNMANDGKHWQEEDLVARLYGLEPGALEPGAEDAHLSNCSECQAKWEALAAVRRAVLADREVPEDLLRAQRQAIFARIEKARSPWRWIPVPVLATAAVLTLGIALHQSAPVVPPPQTIAMSDTQLMAEIASVAYQEEPRATEPLKGLFAEAE